MSNFTKSLLSIEQQIEVLKKRGLLIHNETKAKLFLQTVSFFRLSAYMRPYQEASDIEHLFKEGSNFKQIAKTYEFDRKLRLLVMAAIERIEVAVRAAIGHYLSSKYMNTHWYLERNLFKRSYDYYRLLQTIDRKQKEALRSYQRETYRIDKSPSKSLRDKQDLKVRRGKENYARHYALTYTNPDLMPAWAMLEELTLGDLSYLYAGLAKDADKKAIAKEFKLSWRLLESWLKTLTSVRNICAHHSRLWNRELGIKPELPRQVSIKWPKYQQAFQENTRVAVVISILQYFMLQISPQDAWKIELIKLINDEYPEIEKSMMGLPENWLQDPFWD